MEVRFKFNSHIRVCYCLASAMSVMYLHSLVVVLCCAVKPLQGVRWGAVSRGRGPALGGVCLGIATDLSETRARVPFADRPSVHGMPLPHGSIELVERYRTSYERPSDDIVTSQERGTQEAMSGRSPCRRTPKATQME